MALSVVDLYSKVLPKTNCKECGFPTCIAFAGMVVSEKHPLKNCPYIDPQILKVSELELEKQYKAGKWLKKDMAAEALEWAQKKASSMTLQDIAQRIGGQIISQDGIEQIRLPYFNHYIFITANSVTDESGQPLSRNEQTFVYIHMAHGGNLPPSGNKKSFKEFPNTVSKIVSMQDIVENPIKRKFSSSTGSLKTKAFLLGGKDVSTDYASSDLAIEFTPFPKVPVVLLFWDENEGFEADAKLLFDETVITHLDIEAIMFLSEQIAKNLIA